MRTTSLFGKTIFALLAGTFVLTTPAAAQDARHTTIVTFSAPVRLPNLTLPAGTYTFELPDWAENRDVVVIFGDHGRFVGVAQAAPTMRREVGPTAVLVNDSAAAPPRVSAVFYAGSTAGYEFVYPTNGTLSAKQAKKR